MPTRQTDGDESAMNLRGRQSPAAHSLKCVEEVGSCELRLLGILGSSHSKNSANFAYTAFYEVRRFFGALTCFVPWRIYIPLRQEYAASVTPKEVRRTLG
jgi:hypothetical protein